MAVPTIDVRAQDGNLYVGTSRVTLDSILIPWQAGQTPEQIQADFPGLPLADIYGAIAYYLRNREEVDAWLHEGEELYERQRAVQQAANPEFYARMRERMVEARQLARVDDAREES